MATIDSSIQLSNELPAKLMNIEELVQKVTSKFEALRAASANAIDVNSLKDACTQLNKTTEAFGFLEKGISKVRKEQDKLDNEFDHGQKKTYTRLTQTVDAFNNLGNGIKEAAEQQQVLNQEFQQGQEACADLTKSVKTLNGANSQFGQSKQASVAAPPDKIAGGFGKIIGNAITQHGGDAIKQLMKSSDQFTDMKTKLNVISGGKQPVQELNDKLFQSASEARIPYAEMLSTVGNLKASAGQAFGSNDETIAFSELMAKSFRVGGASSEEQSAGMEQVTQAMAAGRLEGDGLEAVLQKAPLLAQGIVAQMNVPTEKLREMGAQGAITSEILKAAMFSSAEEINGKFGDIPIKFSEIANRIRDTLFQKLQPAFEDMSTWLKSSSGTQAIEIITNALSVMAFVIEKIVEIASWLATVIVNNWWLIGPVIWGIVGALIAYSIFAGLSAVMTGIHTFATKAQEIGLIKAAAAQWGLNTAMLACPLFWIIIGVIALIAIIYIVVNAFNHFAGTSISATGVVAGVFAGLGAFLYNIIAYAWNRWASFGEFFANVFSEPVYSAKRLFVNLTNNVLDLLKTIASAMDAVFGTKYSDTLTTLQDKMHNWLGEKPEGYKVIQRLEMKSIEDSYGTGYDAGKKFEEKLRLPKLPDNTQIEDLLKSTVNNTAGTAANTGAMRNSVDMNNESLEYMRDLAEQEVVNRFTTAELKVDMNNQFGDVKETIDLDGVVKYLEEKVYETLNVAAEGVYI